MTIPSSVGHSRKYAVTKPIKGFWTILGLPGAAITISLVYCAIRFVARYFLMGTEWQDLAELEILSQAWRLQYDLRHPPLLAWVARALLVVTGDRPIMLALLLYAFIATILVGYVCFAKRLLKDERLTVLAVLALIASPMFVIRIHLSYSLFLVAVVALSLWLFARVVERGRLADYIWLGVALGIGSWTKYIFVLPAGAFGLAVVLTPEIRRRINPSRMLLSIALWIGLLIPTIVLVVVARYSMIGLASHVVGSTPARTISSMLLGGWTAAAVTAIYLAPFLVAGIFLNLQAWRIPERQAANSEQAAWARVLILANLFGAGAFILGCALLSARIFSDVWLFPVLLTAPIVIFLCLDQKRLPTVRLKIFAFATIFVVVGAIVGRLIFYENGADRCSQCESYWPAEKFAQDLRGLGVLPGTVIGNDEFTVGNLRHYMRQTRFISTPYDAAIFGGPPPGATKTAIIWIEPAMPPEFATYIPKTGARIQRGDFSETMQMSRSRKTVLHYLLITPAVIAN